MFIGKTHIISMPGVAQVEHYVCSNPRKLGIFTLNPSNNFRDKIVVAMEKKVNSAY